MRAFASFKIDIVWCGKKTNTFCCSYTFSFSRLSTAEFRNRQINEWVTGIKPELGPLGPRELADRWHIRRDEEEHGRELHKPVVVEAEKVCVYGERALTRGKDWIGQTCGTRMPYYMERVTVSNWCWGHTGALFSADPEVGNFGKGS